VDAVKVVRSYPCTNRAGPQPQRPRLIERKDRVLLDREGCQSRIAWNLAVKR
jgi:hypothetical protein